jgi:hypothetical protein
VGVDRSFVSGIANGVLARLMETTTASGNRSASARSLGNACFTNTFPQVILHGRALMNCQQVPGHIGGALSGDFTGGPRFATRSPNALHSHRVEQLVRRAQLSARLGAAALPSEQFATKRW